MIGTSLVNLMKIAKEHGVAIDIRYDTGLEAWRIALWSKHSTVTLAVSDISTDALDNNVELIERRFLDKLHELCSYTEGSVNRCVCCGEVIPEGMIVCSKCMTPPQVKPEWPC